MRKREFLRGAIALSLLFASGCQAPVQLHQLKQPWFALSQADVPVPSIVVGQPSAASGQLTVRFDGALSRLAQGRRIQATVADVEKVVVTVTPATGAAHTETVLKAQLNNGQTSVTFNGLPPGDATITITAQDATGANIGSVTKTATVTAGQTTAVELHLQLAPTVIGGSSGGGSATTGSLAVHGTILDGPVQSGADSPAGTLLGITTGVVGTALAPDGAGNVWLVGSDDTGPEDNPYEGFAVKLSALGEVMATIKLPARLTDVAVDSRNHVWLAGEYDFAAGDAHVYELDPAGGELNRYVVNAGVKALSFDSSDRLFIGALASSSLERVAAGTREYLVAPSSGVEDTAVDSQGRVWVLGYDGISAFAQDGTFIKSVPLAVSGFGYGTLAIDRDDNLWALMGGGVLRKVGQNGDLLGTWTGYDINGNNTVQWSSQRLAPDPQGGMWVRGPNCVDKLDAGGNVKLSLHVPTPYNQAGGMVVHGGQLWVTDGDRRLYRFAL